MVKVTAREIALRQNAEKWLLYIIADLGNLDVTYFTHPRGYWDESHLAKEMISNPMNSLIDSVKAYDQKKAQKMEVLNNQLISLLSKGGLISKIIEKNGYFLGRARDDKILKAYDKAIKELKELVKKARTNTKQLFKLIKRL